MAIPISFSPRAVTAFAVFACIHVCTTVIPPGNGAAPLGLQIQYPLPLTNNGIITSAIYTEYTQLTGLYRQLNAQNLLSSTYMVPNNPSLASIITQSITVITALIATLATITGLTGDNALVLVGLQQLAAHALASVQAAQSNET